MPNEYSSMIVFMCAIFQSGGASYWNYIQHCIIDFSTFCKRRLLSLSTRVVGLLSSLQTQCCRSVSLFILFFWLRVTKFYFSIYASHRVARATNWYASGNERLLQLPFCCSWESQSGMQSCYSDESVLYVLLWYVRQSNQWRKVEKEKTYWCIVCIACTNWICLHHQKRFWIHKKQQQKHSSAAVVNDYVDNRIRWLNLTYLSLINGIVIGPCRTYTIISIPFINQMQTNTPQIEKLSAP